MKKIYSISMAIIVLLGFGGCAKGPQFTEFKKPNKDEANLYVYRKINVLMGGHNLNKPDIHQINTGTHEDDVLPQLQAGGYIMQTLKPGEYQFWAQTEARNEVNLKIEPNKIYCIQHYFTLGFLVPHPQFELQDLSKCETEIKDTKLSLQD